jgi:hypothetical protein
MDVSTTVVDYVSAPSRLRTTVVQGGLGELDEVGNAPQNKLDFLCASLL